MCTKHDEFCTKNDDFNANGQTDNEGPVSCTKSLEGAGTVVTVSKSDAFCTKKRGILYQKRGILYEAQEFCIQNDDFAGDYAVG